MPQGRKPDFKPIPTAADGESQIDRCMERLLGRSIPAQKFRAGQTVLQAGQKPRSLAFVHQGRVMVYHVLDLRRRRLSRVMGPGEWNGVDALADAPFGGSELIAAENSVVSIIPAAVVLESIRRDQTSAVGLVQALARRATVAEHDAALATFADCRARLIRALQTFSGSAAAEPQDDGIRLHLTHSHLAEAIGSARETVSLILSELRRAGVVRTGRNFLIVDLELLRQQVPQYA
ncbi:MAG: Crp/Fnr family transcriptional regulator [Phycisphaerae bacterium]|nr:Crp/Fnr family transcriptional regulator [Phycisphaerae bacterium]MDW8261163.1 Crp/Fnr family transcriptional regulator [Phycisphaerales bacterium]